MVSCVLSKKTLTQRFTTQSTALRRVSEIEGTVLITTCKQYNPIFYGLSNTTSLKAKQYTL